MSCYNPAADSAVDAASASSGRIEVAVVLGASGTVFSDALAPYEVFARSPRFSVAAVAANTGPAPVQADPRIEGASHVADITAGTAPQPDVIVVPAVADPYGEQEAPLRAWLVEQAQRGAHILGRLRAGARVLAAAGGQRRAGNQPLVPAQGAPQAAPLRPVGRRAAPRPGRAHHHHRRHHVRHPRRAAPGRRPRRSRRGPARRRHHELPRLDARLARPASPRHRSASPTSPSPGTPFSLAPPTFGIALADERRGRRAAAFETYAVSFTARAVPVAATSTVTTRHGLAPHTVPCWMHPALTGPAVPGARHDDDIPARLQDWAALARAPVEPFTGPSATGGFDGALDNLAGHAAQDGGLRGGYGRLPDRDTWTSRPEELPHAGRWSQRGGRRDTLLSQDG